jgi:hypothetical protein
LDVAVNGLSTLNWKESNQPSLARLMSEKPNPDAGRAPQSHVPSAAYMPQVHVI